MNELLIVNSMGLTGTELLAAALAREGGIAFLPGQNFVQFRKNLYRPHDYNGLDDMAIFDILSRHLYQKDGRCWMGLTKNMTPAARAHYDDARHRDTFLIRNNGCRDPLQCATHYVLAFFDVFAPARLSTARYAGYWGGNHLLNAPAYADSAQVRCVIDFSCTPQTWLSNIGARLTWNARDAIRFYLAARLATRMQARTVRSIALQYERLVDDPAGEMERVRGFLGIAPATDAEPLLLQAFIQPDAAIIERTRTNAERYARVYAADPLFRAAQDLDTWAEAFMALPDVASTLAQYVRYWNSTFHTNFDFVGPLEQQLIQRLSDFLGLQAASSVNLWFYHEQFSMNSDTYMAPVVRHAHAIGCLEEDIELPLGSYHVRCAIEYLNAVADNIALHQHSFIDLRTSSLYRRLTTSPCRDYLRATGHQERLAQLQAKIDHIATLEGE